LEKSAKLITNGHPIAYFFSSSPVKSGNFETFFYKNIALISDNQVRFIKSEEKLQNTASFLSETLKDFNRLETNHFLHSMHKLRKNVCQN